MWGVRRLNVCQGATTPHPPPLYLGQNFQIIPVNSLIPSKNPIHNYNSQTPNFILIIPSLIPTPTYNISYYYI